LGRIEPHEASPFHVRDPSLGHQPSDISGSDAKMLGEVLSCRSVHAASAPNAESGAVRCAENRTYRSYQPWRKARPRVQPHAWYISQAGVASVSISILSASRARAAKM